MHIDLDINYLQLLLNAILLIVRICAGRRKPRQRKTARRRQKVKMLAD